MILSLAACGQEQKEVEKTEVDSQQQESQSNDESEKEPDITPITLTWGIQDVNVNTDAGILSEKSEIWKYVEEKLGITVELVTWDVEKFQVMAAGNDLPDIVSIPGGTAVADMVDAGLLVNLDDLLDSHGQNLMGNEAVAFAIENVNQALGANYILPTGIEEQSTIPSQVGYFGTFFGRYDVYKAIGSPEIDGLDGLLEVAKQMQDYERARTGRDDIYAFADCIGSGTGSLLIFGMGAEWTTGLTELDLQTAELRDYLIDPDSTLFESYEFLNKAYRMGVFNPDSMLMNGDEYGNSIKNGSTLFAIDWVRSINDDAKVPGYEEYGCLVALPGSLDFMPYLYNRMAPLGYAVSGARAISTNCEHPERAMQLLDWLSSLEGSRAFYVGLEGDTWEYVDGVPCLTEEALETYMNSDKEYWEQKRLEGLTGVVLGNGGNVLTEDGYPADLTSASDEIRAMTLNEVYKAFSNDFGCEYPGQVYAKWVEEGKMTTDFYSDEYRDMLTKVKAVMLSNEFAEIVSTVDNDFFARVDELILAEDDEAFEQIKMEMIEYYKEVGAEKVSAEVRRQIEAMN